MGNVVIHSETAGAFGVVPFDVDARVKGALPIFRDVVVCFDGVEKMDSMFLAHIFNAEVIDNESEHDGPPFVAP